MRFILCRAYIMKKKLQVFVSSTFIDLRDERQAAVDAILKTGHIPAGMELFTAGDKSQMETIKRWIKESDIHMLILGGRYGSIEPTSRLSYTELEYDYAVSLDKPHFAVVIDKDALEKKVKALGQQVIETEHPSEFKKFKEKVLSKMSSFFTDLKDIKLAVHESIRNLEDQHRLKGWVSGADLPETQPLINEIGRITEENKKLLGQVEDLKGRIKLKGVADDDAASFDELFGMLCGISIETSLFAPDKKATKYSVVDVFYGYKEMIIVGITDECEYVSSPYAGKAFESFLFNQVCPKLQVHDLVFNEKVSNTSPYRRFTVTKKGQLFLAYLQKKGLSVATLVHY